MRAWSSAVGVRAPAERAVDLRVRLQSGRPVPGGIHAYYDGTDWLATLTGQGQITINGRSHPSLSAAVQAVKIASRGRTFRRPPWRQAAGRSGEHRTRSSVTW